MSGATPGPGMPSRSMSVGNGPPSAGLPPQHNVPPTPSNAPPASQQNGPQSAQNLNQIVLEYLSKKGYVRTEAMLRKESEGQSAATPTVSREKVGLSKYRESFELLRSHIDDNLELYRPELRKLLWPVFVYSFLRLMEDYFVKDAESFFDSYKDQFMRERGDLITQLQAIKLAPHVKQSQIGKQFMENKYRVTLTSMPFYNLIRFLERKEREGGQVLTEIINECMTIVTTERAAATDKTIAAILARGSSDEDIPDEDEGIPGHNPGHPHTKDYNPELDASKIRLQLGKYQPDQELEEDVRAELQQKDDQNPPPPGSRSLVDEYEQLIKSEPSEDGTVGPNRELVPLPPSLARDVAMEVQKVVDHRDRFRIPGRTGGVGPGLNVVMYSMHNTYDCVNCIEFSGDTTLVAIGMKESYIKVFTMDGSPLPSLLDSAQNSPPTSSRRLIGHSDSVYGLSWSPSIRNSNANGPSTRPQYLLSCSADKTIRLWSTEVWNCLVAYKGHDGPIWDISWGPYGHYFLTGSHDRSARLWSTDNIEPLRLYVGHDGDVDCVAFHPNNLYVFTGSCDNTVRMWHTSQGNCLRLFTGHLGTVTAIACSPDGKTVASGDDHGIIMLWDLESGRRKKSMRGHGKGGIWSLAWSVESTVLVSGGADRTVRVWDVLREGLEAGSGKAADGTAGKVDPLTGKASGGGAGGSKKAAKETGVSADQISAFPTKDTPVVKVMFTHMNLVLAGGLYLPPPKVNN